MIIFFIRRPFCSVAYTTSPWHIAMPLGGGRQPPHLPSDIKYRKAGIDVEVLGCNEASADMLDRFALHDKEERLAASASVH